MSGQTAEITKTSKSSSVEKEQEMKKWLSQHEVSFNNLRSSQQGVEDVLAVNSPAEAQLLFDCLTQCVGKLDKTSTTFIELLHALNTIINQHEKCSHNPVEAYTFIMDPLDELGTIAGEVLQAGGTEKPSPQEDLTATKSAAKAVGIDKGTQTDLSISQMTHSMDHSSGNTTAGFFSEEGKLHEAAQPGVVGDDLKKHLDERNKAGTDIETTTDGLITAPEPEQPKAEAEMNEASSSEKERVPLKDLINDGIKDLIKDLVKDQLACMFPMDPSNEEVETRVFESSRRRRNYEILHPEEKYKGAQEDLNTVEKVAAGPMEHWIEVLNKAGREVFKENLTLLLIVRQHSQMNEFRTEIQEELETLTKAVQAIFSDLEKTSTKLYQELSELAKQINNINEGFTKAVVDQSVMAKKLDELNATLTKSLNIPVVPVGRAASCLTSRKATVQKVTL